MYTFFLRNTTCKSLVFFPEKTFREAPPAADSCKYERIGYKSVMVTILSLLISEGSRDLCAVTDRDTRIACISQIVVISSRMLR